MPLRVGPNRDVLEARRGGGPLMLFGLPFFLAGLFVMLLSLGLIPLKGGGPPWFIGVPFGAVFATVGGAFLFGRAGISIDTAGHTVTTWWGALGFRKNTVHDLDAIEHVTLRKEVRRSKNSTYTVYPVRLAGLEKPIGIEGPRDYKEARALAEETAKFIGKNILDSSSGEEVERDVEGLDESLRERARRTAEIVEMPDAPENMRSECRIEGRQIIVDLPAGGFNPATRVMLVMGLVIPVFVLLVFVRPILKEAGMPTPIKYILVGFITLFFIIGPLVMMFTKGLGASRSSTRIIASPDCLQHERKGLVFKKVTQIPADELEELVLPGGGNLNEAEQAIDQSQAPDAAKAILKSLARSRKRGIIARSDKISLEFGNELPAEELRWIHSVIAKMMTV